MNNNDAGNLPPINISGTDRSKKKTTRKTESILSRMPKMRTTTGTSKLGLVDRLKNLSKRDLSYMAAAAGLVFTLPVATNYMMKPDDSRLKPPGFGTQQAANSDNGVFDPGGTAAGGPLGSNGEVITPLTGRDPSSLIINPGDNQAAAQAAPAPAPVSNNSDSMRDGLRNAAISGAQKAVDAATNPTNIPKISAAIRGIGAVGGEHVSSSGNLSGSTIIASATKGSGKAADTSLLGAKGMSGYTGASNSGPSRGSNSNNLDSIKAKNDAAAGHLNAAGAVKSLDAAAAAAANVGPGAGAGANGIPSTSNGDGPKGTSVDALKNSWSMSGGQKTLAQQLEETAATTRLQNALNMEKFWKYDLPQSIVKSLVDNVITTGVITPIGKKVADAWKPKYEADMEGCVCVNIGGSCTYSGTTIKNGDVYPDTCVDANDDKKASVLTGQCGTGTQLFGAQFRQAPCGATPAATVSTAPANGTTPATAGPKGGTIELYKSGVDTAGKSLSTCLTDAKSCHTAAAGLINDGKQGGSQGGAVGNIVDVLNGYISQAATLKQALLDSQTKYAALAGQLQSLDPSVAVTAGNLADSIDKARAKCKASSNGVYCKRLEQFVTGDSRLDPDSVKGLVDNVKNAPAKVGSYSTAAGKEIGLATAAADSISQQAKAAVDAANASQQRLKDALTALDKDKDTAAASKVIDAEIKSLGGNSDKPADGTPYAVLLKIQGTQADTDAENQRHVAVGLANMLTGKPDNSGQKAVSSSLTAIQAFSANNATVAQNDQAQGQGFVDGINKSIPAINASITALKSHDFQCVVQKAASAHGVVSGCDDVK